METRRRKGTLEDMGARNNIWRDKHGVCHAEGKDKAKVFGLMGYAHRKDRGMQILLMRILGQGRASELLDSRDERKPRNAAPGTDFRKRRPENYFCSVIQNGDRSFHR